MKQLKRAAALALAGAMCVSLFGCGDKKGTGEQKLLSQELGYGYLAEYQPLDAEMEYLRGTTSAGGKIYLQGYYYDEEAGNSSDRIYELDPATGETKALPLPEMKNEANSSENIQTMNVCPDGSGYWLVTSSYTYTPVEDADLADVPEVEDEDAEGAPEDAAEDAADPEAVPAELEEPAAEDDAGLADGYNLDLLTAAAATEVIPDSSEEALIDDYDSGDSQTEYRAKKFDMEGNLIQEIDLTAAVADQEWFYCQYMAQGSDGYLYLATDSSILCFDPDGQRQGDIDLKANYIQNLVMAGNGSVLAVYYKEEGGMAFSTLEKDTATEGILPEGLPEAGNLNIYGGDGDTVLLSDGTLLYAMDVKTGKTTKILSWLDSDIIAGNVAGVAGSEDTLMVVMSKYAHNSGEHTYELGTLTKTPQEEMPQRTVLTLGALYLDDQLSSAVVDFNRKSEDYRITLVDYSQYNTTEDYELGVKQLDMDVVSGNGPDIISLESGNANKYISKGVLADMTDLLKKDKDISEDDLLSGPLSGYRQDGKLYGMPYSFGVQTLYGSAKLLEDRESWTTQEMAEVIGGLDADTQVMTYDTQTGFLSSMVIINLPSLVDYGKATCSFDTDQFKSILQMASHLKKDSESEDGVIAFSDDTYVDEMQQLQQGDVLLSRGYLSEDFSIRRFLGLYVKENGIVNIGYPTDSGNGAILSLYGGLAISDKCQAKEGAWEFVKSTLTEEFQKNQYNLPVLESALDTMLEELKEPPYYMDRGEKVYMESTDNIGDTEYKLAEITDEQLQAFKEYINGASLSGTFYDSDLLEIINEEAAAFFAGDKGVDEVAKLIQDRVKTYLGENS